jgi:hypothetical protein
MPTQLFRLFAITLFTLCLVFAAPRSSAQCSTNTPGFLDIGLTPNNPFQAERVTTRTGYPSKFATIFEDHPQLIARDGQGRVRIDRVTGKFKMQSGPEQGQELQQHIISICDPVAQTLTQLDTLNKTAKITHSRVPTASSKGFAQPHLSLCALKARMANMLVGKTEDLGHQTIDGFDAQGFRTAIPVLTTTTPQDPINGATREEWCAEELSVVLQETTVSSHGQEKSQLSLAKIERVEPDPTLFQIPPDYTISERLLTQPTHQSVLMPQASPQNSSSSQK